MPHANKFNVTLTIRTFRNTDVNEICRVWNEHHAELGPECSINPLRLELCCLAKPYFCESEFFVAEREDAIVGWVHVARTGQENLGDIDQDSAAVAAICVTPAAEDEDDIAAILLTFVDEQLAERNVSSYAFRPMLPHSSFYLGSGVAGSMIGISAAETRICRWLTAAGYHATVPTNAWELDLAAFQPPMNRVQMQIRRSAQVNREVDEPMLPWWQACVLGHTEPTAFQLTHRTEKRVLNEVLFWTVAPELQSSPESAVWLWPPKATEDVEEDADQLVFLIAESLRQFQEERLDVVRTVSAASDTSRNALLRRLGFSTSESGVVFEKKPEAANAVS